MDKYSTKNVDRKHLQAIMDYLDMKDISYSFDGPGETIEFNITELGRKQQEMINKLLDPINESYSRKSIIKENMSLDSDHLQRQLKILADDIKSDDPDVAKAYLFIQHRLNQSFPDGDVSREEIKNILNEPQGRKHSANMPDWALDQLFESRIIKKKGLKLSSLINRIIKEELKRIRLKEAKFNSSDVQIKYDLIGKYAGIRPDAVRKFVEENNLDVLQLTMDVGQGKGEIRSDLVTAIVGKPNNPIQKKVIQTYKNAA